MSLSNPKLVNPCKKFIEFKGGDGIFQYWDKSKEVNIKLPLPIRFIVLDELSTIRGFNQDTASSIYSNEVHNLSTQPLTVRTFKGNIRLTGIYADIKSDIIKISGKYCKSIYAALITGPSQLEFVNFQLKGAAFSAWIDKNIDLQNQAVKVSKLIDGKKGNVTFKIPVYEAEEIDPLLLSKASEIDVMLQEFLSDYEEASSTSYSSPHDAIQPEKPQTASEADDDIPF